MFKFVYSREKICNPYPFEDFWILVPGPVPIHPVHCNGPDSSDWDFVVDIHSLNSKLRVFFYLFASDSLLL